jgi:hypothetical protein
MAIAGLPDVPTKTATPTDVGVVVVDALTGGAGVLAADQGRILAERLANLEISGPGNGSGVIDGGTPSNTGSTIIDGGTP